MNLRSLPAVVKRNISSASFPDNYESAKRALSVCVSIDECKTWADKSAALATYAKEARDESLLIMAKRIRLRAYRRIGELLDEIALPARSEKDKRRRSGQELRERAAEAAGIGTTQASVAVGVARVATYAFESEVESSAPPTPQRLVLKYSQRKTLKSDEPEVFRDLRNALMWLEKVMRGRNPRRLAEEALLGTNAHSQSLLKRLVLDAIEWLDAFEQRMPKLMAKCHSCSMFAAHGEITEGARTGDCVKHLRETDENNWCLDYDPKRHT